MVYLIVFLIELIFLYFLSKKLKRKLFQSVYRLTKSEKWTVVIYSFLFLPGTFIHEMSHFLTGLVLLVPVRQINLIPKLEGEKLLLGVTPVAKTDIIRSTLIGISPLAVGVIVIYFLLSDLSIYSNWWLKALLVYGVFQIANSMFLSRSDIKEALILLILLTLVIIVIYLLGFRIGVSETSWLVQKMSVLFLNASKYFAIPVIIDLILQKILGMMTT